MQPKKYNNNNNNDNNNNNNNFHFKHIRLILCNYYFLFSLYKTSVGGNVVMQLGARCNSMVGAFAHGLLDRSFIVDPLSYFSFQSVLHDWCNKGRGMHYPVCGMVHIKEPLLLIGKSSPCGSSRFPLSLSEWSFTICLTPYNRKIKCVECVVK